MEIRINEEIINFTLEQERVLGDIVDGIQGWLSTNGFTLTEIKKDNFRLQIVDRLEWQNDPIKDIISLDFTALHPMHIAYDKLVAIKQYLHLLQDSDVPDSLVFLDLLKGAGDVAELIDEIIRPDNTSNTTYGNRLSSFLRPESSDGGILSIDEFSSLVAYAAELEGIVAGRLREISEPMSELKITAEYLAGSIKNLADVAVLLQTGNDREALAHLVTFVDLLQKTIRIVRYIGSQSVVNLAKIEIEGETLIGFGSALNGLLIELTDAMEQADTVLIGDLLEYEIAPKLEAFIEALRENELL